MEKEQRNRLQKATQDARKLLEEEFRSQLLQTYDIDVEKVRWAEEPGAHLQAEQRLIREKLVAWIEHKEAQIHDRKEALLLALREMAFTALNRFVALKLMEARELVRPCVSGGLESAGFLEFTAVAQGLLADQESSYRLYLETIFEDVSRELRALFDPRDPASLLWPKRTALQELLEILNRPELAELWIEDETLGWVYQYFNGDAERKKMREESSAPRNSRELAVRNQFFTPRYVVEFLTDNTLGRIWYEMRQGNTGLKDRCRYLVWRPNEIWLQPGEEPPAQADADEALSQEELLRQPVHIPHRPLKDPREIRMLDPACGSMHFGLYAFDLYLAIYEEAWDIAKETNEQAQKGDAFAPFVTYAAGLTDKAAFLREVPRLILQHNVHGIDIDARATQIARLTLWLRAQKAWQEQQIQAADRPPINRSNVVCAEPMPGERELLADFVDEQFLEAERGLVQQLLEAIFDRMQLAGEVGSLLKIEEEIRDAIDQARREWQKLAVHQQNLFSGAELAALGQIGAALEKDLRRLTADFWTDIEERIYVALSEYASHAESGGGFQRRLFAEDAVQGFAFIDICRKRYDVALMNPPFGKCSQASSGYYEGAYKEFKSDVGIAFVDRFASLADSCLVGAITSRAFLASDSLDEWRKERLLEGTPLCSMLDLGYGVLDDAMVEAAAYVIDAGSSHKTQCTFIRALECRNKERAVAAFFKSGDAQDDLLCFSHDLAIFKVVPLAVICYWLPASLLHKIKQLPPLPESGGAARHGLVTTDDWRFLRLTWEIEPQTMRDGGASLWKLLAKGGEYKPFWDDIHICVDWSGDGDYLKTFLAEKRLRTQGSADWSPWLNHSEYYRIEGLTYPERTTSDFCPRILPSDVIFSSTGQAIQFNRSREAALAYLCGAFTRFFKLVVESFVGSGDNAFPGSAAKHYRSGLLNQLPAPLVYGTSQIEDVALEAINYAKLLFAHDETARNYCPPLRRGSIREMCLSAQASLLDAAVKIISQNSEIEQLIANRFALGRPELEVLDEIIGPQPASYRDSLPDNVETITNLWTKPVSEIVEFCIQLDGPRRQLTKKSFIADRKLELICHGLKISPFSVAVAVKSSSSLSDDTTREAAASEFSFAVGAIFGRWDIRYATGDRRAPELQDPFSPLPICPPGMLQGGDGLPLSSEAGRRLFAEGCYPLEVAWDGILVVDVHHPLDLERRIHEALAVLWGDHVDQIQYEACTLLGVPSLSEWFRRPGGFFADHLKRYSKSRRQAPIYWPLSAGNGSYYVWLYYHRLTTDSLYKVLGIIKLRIEEGERVVGDLGSRDSLNGDEASRLQEAQSLLADLQIFNSELDLVAQLWNPNLNDGVIINHAILWRITPYTPWQKKCKECWDKLVKGDYDWAHLAFHLWPERVIPKCTTDRSLAIAHGLEERLWQETNNGNWLPRQLSEADLQALIAEHSNPAVKNALERFLATQPPVAPTRTRASRSPRISGSSTPRRARGSAAVVDAEAIRQVLLALTAAPSDGLAKAAIADLIGVEANALTAVIKQLKESGQIDQLGERRGARYVLSEQGRAAVAADAGGEA